MTRRWVCGERRLVNCGILRRLLSSASGRRDGLSFLQARHSTSMVELQVPPMRWLYSEQFNALFLIAGRDGSSFRSSQFPRRSQDARDLFPDVRFCSPYSPRRLSCYVLHRVIAILRPDPLLLYRSSSSRVSVIKQTRDAGSYRTLIARKPSDSFEATKVLA